jgi:Tol biopolymer transport system component
MCVCTLIGHAQNNVSISDSTIFGNPPDSIPKIFAKGIISIPDRYEYGLSISPNYDELFFTAEKPAKGLMVMKKLDDGHWSIPETANLRGDSSWEFEAFYTPNGQKLYFASDVKDTSRLWFSIKEKTKWSAPKLLESPVNDTPVFWATFTNNNTMYYTNLAVFKIFRSQIIDNQYKKTENVGLPFGIHPYVSKDESFILFNGKGDIYITFRDRLDKWTEPIKLGKLINTSEYDETCPSLSPDGKFIFFSRYNDLNQKSDIYWVSSSIIEKTRREIFK